jgi:hypothetical protein
MSLYKTNQERFFDFQHDMIQAITEVFKKYNFQEDRINQADKSDFDNIIEWMDIHGFWDDDNELTESVKISEMGMRKPTTSFDVKQINKCLGLIQAEMKANFEKEGIEDTVHYEEKPGVNETCIITFTKPLRDDTGKNYMDKAEGYLRGAKINLASIPGDPEILSSIASIAACLDYDNATFINNYELELVNPEVISYNTQLIAPKQSKAGKPKIAEEEVHYGIFSDTGYGPRSSEIVAKIKKRILSDCYECISNPNHKIYRDNGSIYGLFDNREDAAYAIRNRREHEAYSSQYSRSYYRTAYIVAKCNKEGEFIMSLKDFYDPSLWAKYPTEEEIRECIKAYNASILNKGANE